MYSTLVWRCVGLQGSGIVKCTAVRGISQRRQWNAEERRDFLNELAKEHGVIEKRDWKRVSTTDVRNAGGAGLLNKYASFFEALQDTFPEQEWDVFECRKQLPQGYWNDKDNCRIFLMKLEERLGLKHAEDWKGVTGAVVKQQGGARLLQLYNHSVFDALSSIFPERQWQRSQCRPRIDRKHWESRKNRKAVMDRVAEVMGVKRPSDWKRVVYKDVEEHAEAGFLRYYSHSVFAALNDLYPEEQWIETECRPSVRKGYWDNKKNSRQFLDFVARRYNVRERKDWQGVRNEDVVALGGERLLRIHGNSLFSVLQAVYGETHGQEGGKWDPLHCRRVAPRGYWDDEENVKAFIEAVRVEHGIVEKEDWYRLSTMQLRQSGGGRGLYKKQKLIDALRIAYPGEKWDEDELSRKTKRSAQRNLFLCVEQLLHSRCRAAAQ